MRVIEVIFVAILKAALVVALVIAIGVAIVSCSEVSQMSDNWCETHPSATETRCWSHHSKSESWDQETLKKNDHGCPTAIFIAPGGVLEQCP